MVDVAGADVVAILSRAPSAGGKSRLFAGLGRAPDPVLLQALLLDTLDAVAVAGMPRVVAVEPASGCEEVRRLVPPEVRVVPQDPGTLGARMRMLFERLLRDGARTVVLVGSDLPDLPPGRVHEARARLARDPGALVLGPAADGGYYLIGAARTPPAVFDGIRWGGPDVLAATLGAAAGVGWRVHLLDPWADVDSVPDLRALGRRPAGDGGAPATRTRRWMTAAGLADHL